MKEKKRKDAVKIKITDKSQADQNEDEPQKEKGVEEEKPLEEMSQEELLQKVKESKEQSDKNYDLYLRSQAEIENIIKRNKKEKEDWIKYSNETLIKEILPVIDSLEKAISYSNNENSVSALKEGMELTLKGLRETLTKSGLKEVEAKGKPFDPSLHHAVSEQEDKDVERGIILEEFQKGYTLNQRLIRPSMVVLSKGRTDNKNDEKNNPE